MVPRGMEDAVDEEETLRDASEYGITFAMKLDKVFELHNQYMICFFKYIQRAPNIFLLVV